MDARPPGPPLPGAVQGLSLLLRPLEFLRACQARYGDCFRTKITGVGEIVFIADPADVKEVFLGSPDVFHGGEGNAEWTEPALGMGVMNLDGPEHLRHRKLLLPPFKGENVAHFEEDVFADVAVEEIDRWTEGGTLRLLEATQRIALGSILRALIGDARAVRVEDVAEAVRGIDKTGWVLLLKPLERDLGRHSPWRRFLAARERLDQLLYAEIAARRGAGDGGRDVLSMLLDARDDEGAPMTPRELRDEIVTMIFAGYETTAASLAHAFERILRTPHVLRRIVDAPDDEEYLNAVISETLRLRPSVTDSSRILKRETVVAGYRLPAGSHVIVALPLVLGRPQTYRDPLAFRPERFLEDRETEPYSFIPWGGGVRRCIGNAFAQAEMRVVLRTVFERVSLQAASPKAEIPRYHLGILVPGRGSRAVMTGRRRPRGQRFERPAAVGSAVTT